MFFELTQLVCVANLVLGNLIIIDRYDGILTVIGFTEMPAPKMIRVDCLEGFVYRQYDEHVEVA